MTGSRPRFTIVTAVYNVEPYLPDFIESIEAQRFDRDRIEVIAVDDGSTDGSLALLEAWARRRPDLVKVLTKPNGGQGSARNLGLEHATGEWVTFTDPDDMLDPAYFHVAQKFAADHPDIEMLGANPVLFLEATGRMSDTHPRRRQFVEGNRRVSLVRDPNTFTGSATSLLKLDRINAFELRFDPRITPKFEDGHLAARYLMSLPKPEVGILRDAKYIYRKRAAKDSALQRSLSDPGLYSNVLRFGYLDLLERAQTMYGSVPPWLQHLVIYELSWYLSEDEKVGSAVWMAPDKVAIFHDLLAQVLTHIEPSVVRRHTARPLKSVWADIIAHGCRSTDWHSLEVVRSKVDVQMGLERVGYRYVGAAPREEIRADGAGVQPVYAKTMSHTYYGRPLMSERMLWLPRSVSLQVQLDGVPARIRDGWPEPAERARTSTPVKRLWRFWRLERQGLSKAVARRGRTLPAALGGFVMRRVSALPRFRSRFQDAWVLMDRTYDASDNGERLFQYLRAERPDINAWFAIEKGTPDWKRMRAEGSSRLVAHGSLQWKILMLNASWLLSSHADHGVVSPQSIMRLIEKPTWRFGFLQHGVIKEDLSRWLNLKDIDLFVVSTDAEYESITADGTSYALTTKETRRAGLPRFDRLLAKGLRVPSDEKDLVIVAPTWRSYLTLPFDPVTKRRPVSEAIWDSDYLRQWTALLRSTSVAAAAERKGLRVAFMPHPNMQPILTEIDLPAHVRPLTFAGEDVQDLYARCAVLVTDYSSVAFDLAYLGSPVVYFQFDQGQILSGAHLGQPGYFDYERDGFGPLATDLRGAEDAIVAAIEHGPRPSPEYQQRAERTFVDRDGQACARVVAAIEELSRPSGSLDPSHGR